jgi:Xaa-Pro aminopeptidase
MGQAMNFERDEFEQRYARLQRALEQDNLDALLVTHEANFNYFTGFVVQQSWVSFSRNLIAIIPREGAPVLLVPASLASEARTTGWIERVEPHDVVGAAPVERLAEVCCNLGLDRARIGAELGYEQRLNLSYRDVEQLRSLLPSAQLIDAAPAIWRVRMRKSEAEIECLRRACAIVDATYEQLFAEVRAGMTEREIARRVGVLMLENGADRVGWIMMTSGQGQYHRTLGTPRDRAVQQGEMLWLDLSAIYHGYASDFCRAGMFGGPTAEQAALQEKVYAATMAGVRAVRPGALARDIAAACNAELSRQGLEPLNVGRLGHALGLLSTEPPDVSVQDETVLEPGMVLTIEPTVIRDDGIFEVEQNVVVTETGREILSKSPPSLRVLRAGA